MCNQVTYGFCDKRPKYSLLLKRNLGLIWMLELERYTHILSWYCSCKFSNFSSLISWKLNATVLCAVAAVGACSDRVDLQHLRNKNHHTLFWDFFFHLFRVLFVLWSWQFRDKKLEIKCCVPEFKNVWVVAEHNNTCSQEAALMLFHPSFGTVDYSARDLFNLCRFLDYYLLLLHPWVQKLHRL